MARVGLLFWENNMSLNLETAIIDKAANKVLAEVKFDAKEIAAKLAPKLEKILMDEVVRDFKIQLTEGDLLYDTACEIFSNCKFEKHLGTFIEKSLKERLSDD